jgi:beta-fructofuranosidase
VRLGVSTDLSSVRGLVWDCWFPTGPAAPPGLPEHVFFLHAESRWLPTERNSHARLGHAVRTSSGLWLPDEQPVLTPRPDGFDQTIWSGSVLSLDDDWHLLLYTGCTLDDPAVPYVQRVGLAVCSDPSMEHWVRYADPVLVPGAPYSTYEGDGAGHIFRDPYLFVGPDSRVYAAFSARLAESPPPFNACIGLAVATNDQFTEWQFLPPLADGTAEYSEMEVPQVIEHDGKWYIFFTVHARHYAQQLARQLGEATGGLHCFVADAFGEPAAPANADGLVWDHEWIRAPRLFGVPSNDTYAAQGWRDGELTNRDFIGGLGPLMSVTLAGREVTARLYG